MPDRPPAGHSVHCKARVALFPCDDLALRNEVNQYCVLRPAQQLAALEVRNANKLNALDALNVRLAQQLDALEVGLARLVIKDQGLLDALEVGLARLVSKDQGLLDALEVGLAQLLMLHNQHIEGSEVRAQPRPRK